MQRYFKGRFIPFLAAITLLLSVVAGSFAFVSQYHVFASGAHQNTSRGNLTGTGKAVAASLVSTHSIDMASVPAETPTALTHRPTSLPLHTGVSATVYAQRKAAAAHNKNAPTGHHIYSSLTTGAYTPAAKTSFAGMADSASICGCQPPDMALAASKSYVLQGVNTSFAVYSSSGTIQSGWPKSAKSFFGVPNPGSCSPSGPFLSDPRAFYDPNDKRFWAAILEVEGAFGVNNCPFVSRYWIGVSSTSDPRGTWHIFAYDMAIGTTNGADYTQFGFDGQAIYFSGNMFDQSGSFYQYAQILSVKKSTLEGGSGATAYGFRFLSFGGVTVDTVQPVEVEAYNYGGPRGGLFISSFNGNGDPFGDDCFSTACHGYVIWSIANPGTSSAALSSAITSGSTYLDAPNADEPGCLGCIETLDTRISGTPVYHDGMISFALETNVYNGSQNVPAILWGQVVPSLNDNGSIASASVFQNGYYVYGGDNAASFGALMPDADGNLFMVFEFMSRTTNPEVAYTARRATYTLGLFHDGGFILKVGASPTFDSRWGDYEATSYDGVSTNNVWFSGQYSASNGDWATQIGKDVFSLSTP